MFNPDILIPVTPQQFTIDSSYPVILVDSSWVLLRSYAAYKERNTGTYVDGEFVYTGEMYGYLNSILMLKQVFPGSVILQCLDAQNPVKKVLYEEYKANRKTHTLEFIHFNEILSTAALIPNVYISYAPQTEADDILYILATALFKKDFSVILYTRDQDLYQTLQESDTNYIKMFWDYVDKKPDFFTVAKGIRKYGVKPSNFPLYKALVGDSSDNYKGYPRIYKKHAAKIAECFSTPSRVLSETSVSLPVSILKTLDKIRQNPHIMLRNFEMAQIQEGQKPGIYTVQPSTEELYKYKLLTIRKQIELMKELGY